MSSIAFGARRAEVDQRRRAHTGRGRVHDGPEPWSRRAVVVLAAVLLLAVVGITVGWAGAGGEATLDDQRGWLALALGSLILGALGMVAWLLVGLQAVATLRRPVVAEVRRRKSASLAVRPQTVLEADLPSGFGAADGMRRYHRAECLLLVGKSAVFATAADHEADGLIPCGVCLPEGTPADVPHA